MPGKFLVVFLQGTEFFLNFTKKLSLHLGVRHAMRLKPNHYGMFAKGIYTV